MRADGARTYELRVDAHLDERWASWFDQLELVHHDDGTTTLTGPVFDQAQLYGILARLRDLGATLLCCRVLPATSGSDAARTDAARLNAGAAPAPTLDGRRPAGS